MKTIETNIRIEASPAAVWQQLMDFESHAQWNPFIISIKGEAKPGAILKNILQVNEKKQMQFEPEVLVVAKSKEFRWKGKLYVKGLFDGEHYFLLEEQDDGSTELIHGEVFTGLLSNLLFSMIGEDTRKGFEAMNRALKQQVEQKGEELCHAC